MRSFRILLASTLAVVAPAVGVDAQIVDYAALNEAFGEPITTSVTGKPQRATEAPASVTIITSEEIARSPARNVPDLLKAQVGVDVNRWTAGQSDVAIRGGVQTYNARLLVLVDGRQVYLDHYGMTNWNLLGVQLDEIQQIELVRGPASALFGFNAASGVVNIVTKRSGTDTRFAARAEGGTHGYARLSATAALPLTPDIGLRLSAGHQEEDERRIPSRLYQPPFTRGVGADQLSGTLFVQAGARTSIELNGGLGGNRQLEFLPSQILTEQRFRNQTLGVLVNHDTSWGSLSARSYTNWLQADYGVTTPVTDPYSAVADLRARNRISVSAGSALVRLGAIGSARVGVEYRDSQLSSERLYSMRIGYKVAALSGMLDLHPTDRVALTGAARVDSLWLKQGGAILAPQIDPTAAYDRTITPVSFNVAGSVQIGETGRLRVNGGRGLQLPSLIDLGLHVAIPAPDVPVPVYLVGDPRLLPVQVDSLEAGYSQGFGSGLRMDVTLFYTRVDRLIASPGGAVDVTLAFTPEPVAVARFANVGAYTSQGIELAASGRVQSKIGWSANYSLTRVDENIPANRDAAYYALFPKAATPRHRANVTADYANDTWSAAVMTHLATSSRQSSFLPDTNLISIEVPASISVDAKLTRAMGTRVEIYVAGENLSAARGVYASPIPADRRIRVGVSARL
ncbi:TonB-dependent receptor plug domain-containing protein [Sphingomonas phyllosphaerae]|uniref:TonB-dependent receptor plug domain-containing protein n=1 Tax=Sphingomonas phyllosphaerae TaxID=257003 RepID=UPI00041A9E3F|nr:TonB-dependent receptor [Sphingomonas phyllosphaerae]